MKVSDLILEFLIENDVEIVFGVPGDTSMCFHNSFEKYKDRIKYLSCRDERHAVYMADTYSRVSGKIGVCDVPSGGGILYAVPGLSEATSSSIPIVCFSSDISTESEGTGALTELNQEAITEGVTKWNVTLKKPSKTLHTLEKAFRISKNGRPGAVHISIPENIHESDIEDEQASMITKVKNRYINTSPDEEVTEFLKLLSESKKPIILAGGGVHLSKAYKEVEEFSSRYEIPVVTSINGKGSLNEVSEFSVGVIGVNGGSDQTNRVVREADLVLVLGSKLNNVTTVGKTLFNKNAKLVQVDINEEILELNFKTSLSFLSDIKGFLKTSLSLSSNQVLDINRNTWFEFIKNKKSDKNDLASEESNKETKLVNPLKVIKSLEKLTDENSLFVIDAGTQSPYMASNFNSKKSTRQMVFDRGHGNLGYALSASIGAYYAKPNSSKVFSMFGDGSFAMSVGELETVLREQIPIVFLLFQNNTYGWIKKLHQLYYDEKYIAVDFSEIDGAKIAEGFGIESKRVVVNEEIEDGLKWAMKQNKPVFLEFVIEPITDIIPPVTNWREDSKKDPKDRQALTY